MNILLAEDDTNISTIAIMALEHFGSHKVTHVDNGLDALETAKTGHFDLIILDQMMPIMNGLSVCKEYKSQTDTPTPIIFLSAKCHPDDVAAFNENGLGHIQKPFDPATLCQQIDELISTLQESVA